MKIRTVGALAGCIAFTGYFAHQALSVNKSHSPRASKTRLRRNYAGVVIQTIWCDVGKCAICHGRINLSQRKILFRDQAVHKSCVPVRQQNRNNADHRYSNCFICSICSKEIGSFEGVFLKCKHFFHKLCLKKWKEYGDNVDRSCPDCPFCTICLEEIKTFVRILSCNHTFHNRCIQNWLERGSRTCPNCKRPV